MANKKNLTAEIKTEKPNADTSANFCMYIGPTIVGAIQNGTIYQGNKKQVMASLELAFVLEKYPLAADLLVDGKKLAASRQQLKQPGNLLHNKYKQLQKIAAGRNLREV